MTRTCPKCRETKPLDEFERNKTKPHGRAYRCSACARAKVRAYYDTHTDQELTYAREWQKRRPPYTKDPFKESARQAVKKALRHGRLVRVTKCENCETEGYTEAHHQNYNRPLDVQWLCRNCHADTRRKDNPLQLPPREKP